MLPKLGNFWSKISLLVILGNITCVVFANDILRRPNSVTVNSLLNNEENRGRVKSSSSTKLRGLHFNVGIPVPNAPLPDPTYTLSQTLDYWPYKKFYTVQLSSVLHKLSKVFWYFYELLGLLFRIVFQIFDIFQMRKSFDALSHGGHGWGDDRGLRNLGRLFINPNH